jgi:hypothetical protein
MVVTQHLRDEGPVVTSIHWKTRPGPRYRACFRLTRNDVVTVSVVDVDDRSVRVLADDRSLAGGDAPHCFDWDGRGQSGQPVAAGIYHLRFALHDADRVAISGEHVNISAKRVAPA